MRSICENLGVRMGQQASAALAAMDAADLGSGDRPARVRARATVIESPAPPTPVSVFRLEPVGYAMSVSRGESVFVAESREPVSALEEGRGRVHGLQFLGRIGPLQIECVVWPVAVVVAGEDAEHPLEMTPVHD